MNKTRKLIKPSRLILIKSSLVILIFIFIYACAEITPFTNELEQVRSLSLADKKEEALNHLEVISQNYPQERYLDQIQLQRGDIYLANNEFKTAAFHYQKFLEMFPRSKLVDQARYNLALSSFGLKDFVTTVKLCSSMLEQKLKTDLKKKTFFLLGQARYEQQHYMEAAFAFQQASELGDFDQFSKAAVYQEALSYYQRGYFQKALDELLKPRITLAGEELSFQISQLISKIYVDLQQNWQAVRFLVSLYEKTTNPEYRKEFLATLEDIITNKLTDAELVQVEEYYRIGFPADLVARERIKRLDNSENYPEAIKKIFEFEKIHRGSKYLEEIKHWRDEITLKMQVVKSKIGVILPLSGDWSVYGSCVLNGIKIALQKQHKIETMKVSLELVIRDSKGKPEEVPALVRDLIEKEQVIAIIGPLRTRTVEAAAPLAEELQTPLITPGASAKDLPSTGKFIFRNCLLNWQQASAMARFASENLRLERFAILYPDEPYGQELADLFQKYIQARGGEIVRRESYNNQETDFGAQLQNIKRFSPQAIYIPDTYKKAGLIAPQVDYYDMEEVTLLGSDGWNSLELIDIGRQYVNNSYFTDAFFVRSDQTLVRNFVEEYQAKFKEEPNRLAALGYDTARLILEALRLGASTRESVRKNLLKINDFNGVTGRLSITAEGDTDRSVAILTVRKGQIIQVQ